MSENTDTDEATTSSQHSRRTLLKAVGGATAAGGLATGTAAAWENTIKIVSLGGGVARYTFCVSGKLKQQDWDDTVFENDGQQCAQGHVGPKRGTDTFVFTGELTSLDLNGPAKVILNGKRIDPDHFTDRKHHHHHHHHKHDDEADCLLDPDADHIFNKLVLRTEDPSAKFKICVTGVCKLPSGQTASCFQSSARACGCKEKNRVVLRFSGEVRELELFGPITVCITQA